VTLHAAGIMYVTRFIAFPFVARAKLFDILEEIRRRTAADRAPYDQVFQPGFGGFETQCNTGDLREYIGIW